MSDLIILPVTTMDQARAVGQIAIAAWGSGDLDAIPDHMVITVARYSGVVLLGYLDETPVTFCLSFLAKTESGDLHHHSHIAATLPEHWGKGYAAQIKRAQADAVYAQGVPRMTWTYDPLETRNARLNLHKLGAVCNTYKRDVYGEMRDSLNIGLTTDRFQVDWHLPYTALPPKPDHHSAQAINAVTTNAAGDLVTPNQTTIPDAPLLKLYVPNNILQIKTNDLPLGVAWRNYTREVFETCFSKGYKAVDLVVEDGQCAYVLHRG